MDNQELNNWIKEITLADAEWVKDRRLEYLNKQREKYETWIIRSFGVLTEQFRPKIRSLEAEIGRWTHPRASNGSITDTDIENAKNASWEAIESESKPAGTNRRKVCCPFHQEKTPSMVLYEDGGAHCFGCGWHNDIIGYVMQRDNLSCIEAVKFLN